jgi:hypothetical protein
MANLVEFFRAIALENALREQARAESRAELDAKKPSGALRLTPMLGEDEFHGLVRVLWQRGVNAVTIGGELGCSERHVRRLVVEMGLQRPEAAIPPELRARCEALRERRSAGRANHSAVARDVVANATDSPADRTESVANATPLDADANASEMRSGLGESDATA